MLKSNFHAISLDLWPVTTKIIILRYILCFLFCFIIRHSLFQVFKTFLINHLMLTMDEITMCRHWSLLLVNQHAASLFAVALSLPCISLLIVVVAFSAEKKGPDKAHCTAQKLQTCKARN